MCNGKEINQNIDGKSYHQVQTLLGMHHLEIEFQRRYWPLLGYRTPCHSLTNPIFNNGFGQICNLNFSNEIFLFIGQILFKRCTISFTSFSCSCFSSSPAFTRAAPIYVVGTVCATLTIPAFVIKIIPDWIALGTAAQMERCGLIVLDPQM